MASDDKEETNPFKAMAELWTQGAKAYTETIKSFMQSTQEAMKETMQEASGSGFDATTALRDSAKQWSEAARQLSEIQSRFVEELLREMPQKATQGVNAATFSQLNRMANARWQDELRRLFETPANLGEKFTEMDAQQLAPLLHSMAAEYLRDMNMIQANAMEMKLEPLAKAWQAVSSGNPSEKEKRTIDRLFKALGTKLQYGAEYYADPDDTPVGQTPREEVHQVGKITLYRYLRPEGVEPRGDPCLIVYSIINKPYILDLVPGFSFIEHLLALGLDVYMIEWGETEPGDRLTTLDSYIDPGIHSCVQYIKNKRQAERISDTPEDDEIKVSLFGHCIGGNLSLLYASLYPEDVARVVTLTTPGTSAKGGVVGVWTNRDLFPVDSIVESFGYMPGKLIRYTFMALKPYFEVLKWKLFMEKLDNDEVMHLFYPVDRWANENVDLPGEVFRKFVVEVLHEDRFRLGETTINGRVAALQNVTCPLFNLAASKDWIVPAESAEIIGDAVGSEEKYFTLIRGAHVAIMIDPRTRNIWTEMSDFLLGKAPH